MDAQASAPLAGDDPDVGREGQTHPVSTVRISRGVNAGVAVTLATRVANAVASAPVLLQASEDCQDQLVAFLLGSLAVLGPSGTTRRERSRARTPGRNRGRTSHTSEVRDPSPLRHHQS